jgi:hypothetical protein
MKDNIIFIDNKGCQTLLAWINKGPYPMPQGNEITYGRRVLVNLHAENLDYLLDNKIVEFPIKCEILDDRRLAVIDERIPSEFLFDQRIIENLVEIHKLHNNQIEWKKIPNYKAIVDEKGIIYCPYIPVIKRENPVN